MSDLLAARSLMALSLAFHIVFASIGIAMPLLMVVAEGRWLRTRDPVWLELCKRWSKGTAILFAVGAVSGTALSFQLGLLWPGFMRQAGPVIGLPFAMEGFAFFLEAICLGLYLYGWQKLRPRAHQLAGVGVMVAGIASGVFVIAANAWMNGPRGCRHVGDRFVDVDPIAAMCNPMWLPQAAHMLLATFLAVGFGTAGVHAWMLLRRPDSSLHRRAVVLALWMGGTAAVLLPLSGDLLAKRVAELQPVKLAAMEGLFASEQPAALRIGGWPDEAAGVTRYAIELPYLLSFLAHGDFDAKVRGLDEFPRDEWPPVAITHVAFQVMVGLGVWLLGVAIVAAFLAWRRRPIDGHRWFLKLLVGCAPLGFLGIEAGWVVTEVGRQPWIVQGVMRTRDAVTPVTNLLVPFCAFTLLYGLLFAVVVRLMRRHVFESAEQTHA
ncbi:MAG TPA: cytochrome ubiquinol oxidase subunit I [Planctomycetota bacterium]|nr:cytochrome ubiquinol oxidase subunit I [Planctomycetota bacterium]